MARWLWTVFALAAVGSAPAAEPAGVQGKVLDSAGRPVAGVRVFNSGDAHDLVSTTTDSDGRFRLDGLYRGPVFVFAQKAGYRFTALRVPADRPPPTLTLLKADEPVPPRPPSARSLDYAEQQQIARKLIERLWALPPEQKRDITVRTLECLARLDPGEALRRAGRAGGRGEGRVRTVAAAKLADTDADEALALLGPVDAYDAYLTLHELTERFVRADPARALRFAEEAVLRARTVDQPARTWSLAEMGTLLVRLGQARAGRKLIDEAAETAAKLGTEQHQALARGMVAEALVPYDRKRADALLEPLTNQMDRLRYWSNMLVARAAHDPDLVREISRTPLPWGRANLRVAYALAEKQPADAVRAAEAITDAKQRAEAFAWVAVAVALKDRALAWSLIDRSLAVYLDRPDEFRSWASYGGASVFAARVVGQAREVGYPDPESVVARVLATRTPGLGESSAKQVEATVATAWVLALADPATAKQLLEAIEPHNHLVGSGGSGSIYRKHWLQAWALADPGRAAELFEQELAAHRDKSGADLERDGVLDLVEALTVPPPERARHLLRHYGGFWFPGEE